MDSRCAHPGGGFEAMIRLHKGDAPAVLTANHGAWTAELLALVGAGAEVPKHVGRRYAHPDIKAAVRRDSFDKCVYCESKVTHVTFGDVEHIRPKAVFRTETFEWNNLAFVCTRCNNAKLDTYDQAAPPINPYVEDPSDFLSAVGALVWPRPGSDRGTITESLLKLNRPELVAARTQRLESVRRLVDAIARATNVSVKQVLAEQLQQEVAADREFSFVARALVSALNS
jgi:hypothetical protein